MALYEHVFLARQDVSQQQVDALVEQYTGLISEMGGSVAKSEYWGMKSLSFRIKKNRKAHYTLMNIDAPSDAVSEMERQMGINEDVLRFMTIRVDEFEEGPSAMMRKSDRDDRRPGGRGERGDRPDRGERRPRRDEDSKPASEGEDS
ncbi:MAG: 30S ribosomal protein S6 [Hyphomicrobiales bacterium]|jgi:small subunit ribosomal protein S6